MDFQVILYTDGACMGNPGPGGWASILVCKGHEKILCGGDCNTTNNRMELSAVIEGLKALKFPCEVTVITDSKYVCDSINLKWLNSWKKKGWKHSDSKPLPNKELWMELDKLLNIHNVKFQWVKGHDGHPYNERCDKIAVEQSHIYKQ